MTNGVKVFVLAIGLIGGAWGQVRTVTTDASGNVNLPGNLTVGTTVINPTTGIKTPVIACVGTPGNSTGPYGSLCEVRATGALWACIDATGCTTSGDWAAAGGSGAGSVFTTVAYSATPTFTVSTSAVQVFEMTLTGNVTSSTLTATDATDGQYIIFRLCQDGTGSRTVVWPASVVGYGAVDSTASSCSTQAFIWDGTDAVAASPMVSDATPPALVTADGVLGLPTAPDTLMGRGRDRRDLHRSRPTWHAGGDPCDLHGRPVLRSVRRASRAAAVLLHGHQHVGAGRLRPGDSRAWNLHVGPTVLRHERDGRLQPLPLHDYGYLDSAHFGSDVHGQ
jgi:hypothetical protein